MKTLFISLVTFIWLLQFNTKYSLHDQNVFAIAKQSTFNLADSFYDQLIKRNIDTILLFNEFYL